MLSCRRCAFPLLAAAVLLAACQSPSPKQVDAASAQALPKIVSSTVVNGKGVPNGRSDSNNRYLSSPLALADDAGYGYSQANPVKIGPRSAVQVHIVYLNSLRGPKGEAIEYERKGACCHFASPASPGGMGLLDLYRLRVDGESQDRYLFVDMYTPGPPMIPAGLTQRQP